MENIEENSKPIQNEFTDGENIDHTKENSKPIPNELIDDDTRGTDGLRNEENIDKNSSSNILSVFEKKHPRTNRSFGAGHEPGTIPGGGV